MDLTVAIINYQTRAHLYRSLSSLVTPSSLLTPGKNRDFQLLVIDNASRDGSADLVAERFGTRVELIANRQNIGFGRAVNQALAHTNTRYLLVLNADIEATPDAVKTLYCFMEATPGAGLAGGKLIDPHGELQHSCRRFYTPMAIVLRRTWLGHIFPNHPALRDHLMLEWNHEKTRTVDWLQGACLMIRRSATKVVGSMDEQFFLYFEDVDLCRRMTAAGFSVYYVPSATFVHHYQRGSKGGWLTREKFHHLRSGLRYFAKWRSPLTRLGKRRCSPHPRGGQNYDYPTSYSSRVIHHPIQRGIKRLGDLLLASGGLILTAPLLVCCAVVIRLQDQGPVIFAQLRLGRSGEKFTMFKLRTMTTSSTSLMNKNNIAEGPLTLIPNDPRVTPFGSWLRRHKIDEIPQLFNVLLGQMSIVGPRPPLPDEVLRYQPWHKERLEVTPGITGLWQIDKERRWRFEEMVELDLKYIFNWSLLLDYSVMLRTIPVMLRGN